MSSVCRVVSPCVAAAHCLLEQSTEQLIRFLSAYRMESMKKPWGRWAAIAGLVVLIWAIFEVALWGAMQ